MTFWFSMQGIYRCLIQNGHFFLMMTDNKKAIIKPPLLLHLKNQANVCKL